MAPRVCKEVIDKDFAGRLAFVAHNVRTVDFGDPVFPAYAIREVNGVPVAIIGQAFPYTPISNPRHFVPDWTFGIQEDNLQAVVGQVRAAGAQVVVLLSHNGMDVDLKLAGRVTGLDAILGGHTHDGVPQAIEVANASGKTLVTNAGSNGKFLGVLDLDVKHGKVAGYRYRLLPVFANLLPEDPQMSALIAAVRAPVRADPRRSRSRRAKACCTGAAISTAASISSSSMPCWKSRMRRSPSRPASAGARRCCPGETITREDLLAQTAITYPYTTVTEMSGETIKTVLEEVADNLFNPDPYYQQGGDMVRVGGLTYTCAPNAQMGSRISDMRLDGRAHRPGQALPGSRLGAGGAGLARASRCGRSSRPI